MRIYTKGYLITVANRLDYRYERSIVLVIISADIVPGIISGITMVFVPSISTFYISQKLGGGNFDLIGDTIERQFQTAYNYNLGASMSFVLMLLIIISMTVLNKYADDDGGVII